MTDTPPPTGDAEPPSAPDAPPASAAASVRAAGLAPTPPAPATRRPPRRSPGRAPEHIDGPAPGVEFAPHGQRLVAYILDGVIITSASAGPWCSSAALCSTRARRVVDNQITSIEPGAVTGFVLLTLLAIIIGLVYFPGSGHAEVRPSGCSPFGLPGRERPGWRAHRLGDGVASPGRPVGRRRGSLDIEDLMHPGSPSTSAAAAGRMPDREHGSLRSRQEPCTHDPIGTRPQPECGPGTRGRAGPDRRHGRRRRASRRPRRLTGLKDGLVVAISLPGRGGRAVDGGALEKR